MSKPQININNKYDRVIALIDMDCFYCQVEEQLNPELKGKPIAVVQYNAWRGGGIIAVNYPARANGVTRHMRGDEAKEQCPDIELVKVPNIREKADLSKYRDAGKQVAAVLQTFTPLLTRASVDEAYLDVTEQVKSRLLAMNEGKFSLQPEVLRNTYAIGYQNIGDYVQDISKKIGQSSETEDEMEGVSDEDHQAYRKSDIKLLIGASIISEIRAAVKEKTGYECSAGIAHNKILAKLVCGMNKPNKQTILPLRHIGKLYGNLPVRKVQGLGGKFGEKLCEDLRIQNMGELIRFSKDELQKRYDERNGLWLYNIARGIDLEAVTPRLTSKSIGCCKKFPGRNAITGMATLTHWLHELATEICERLEQDEIENNRKPKQMVVSFVQAINNVDVSSSRTVNLTLTLDEEKIVNDAIDILKKNTEKFFKTADDFNELNNPIKFLGLNVGKFESSDSKRDNTIENMFKKSIDNKSKEVVAEQKDGNNDGDKNVESIEGSKDKLACNSMTKENSTTNENECERSKPKKVNDIRTSFFANLQRPKSKIITTTTTTTTTTTSNAETVHESSENQNVEPICKDSNENSKSHNDHDDENVLQNQMLIDELVQNDLICKETRSNLNTLIPSTSTATAYEQTYAEFYRPPQLEIPKVKCSQCSKMVNVHELQIHNDAHLAFQLTQEQRVEFQNQLKKPTIAAAAAVASTAAATPPAKKQKTNNNRSTTAPSSLSIQKFLIKKEPAADDLQHASQIDAINMEMEKCTECGKHIPIVDIFEHMDFHAAKKLQQELMQLEMLSNRTIADGANDSSANKNLKTKNPKKKTNKNSNNNINNTSKSAGNSNSMKSIASFFHST